MNTLIHLRNEEGSVLFPTFAFLIHPSYILYIFVNIAGSASVPSAAAAAATAAVISAMPTKTPISVLQEFCAQRGMTPTYDLIANEGEVVRCCCSWLCRVSTLFSVFCVVGLFVVLVSIFSLPLSFLHYPFHFLSPLDSFSFLL